MFLQGNISRIVFLFTGQNKPFAFRQWFVWILYSIELVYRSDIVAVVE